MSLAAAYAKWRTSELGRITDRIEHALLLEAAATAMGARVLDLGCGDGALAERLAQSGANVTGLDSDSAMIELARARARLHPFALVRADARSTPFASSTFDVVILSTLLCLIDEPVAVINEGVRVLKSGGRLVIGELGAHSLWNVWRRMRGLFGADRWRNAHFFTPGKLRRLVCAAGVEPERVTGGVHYPPSARAAHLLARFGGLSHRRPLFGAAFLVISGVKRR